MRLYISLILFALIFASCKDQEKIITKPEGSWTVSQMSENLSFTEGLVAFSDTSQAGQISFHEDGTATFTDANGEQSLNWSYDKQDDAITIGGRGYYQNVQGLVVQRNSLTFDIQESSSNKQLWRSEESFRSWNPFTGDSTTALLVIQWELAN